MSHGHLLIMVRIYGLKNCDACRRAIKDLKKAGMAYVFCDFRRDGLEIKKIEEWQQLLGFDLLLNKRGITWRSLSESVKNDLTNKKLVMLMFNNPALIKRPIFEIENKVIIGYKNEQKEALGW